MEIVGLVGVWSGIYVVTGNLNPERKDLAVSVGGQDGGEAALHSILPPAL